MTDLRPIEELSDKHLAAMSARARPSSDLEAAKDEVFSLEIKLREATTTHNKTFRPGMTDAKAMQSQLAIDRIKEQLLWARRDLEGRQKYTDHLAAHDAREANAHLPKNRLFAVKDEHGRIIRHRAASQAQLTGELTPGYTIVAEVFGFASDGTGGIAVSTDPNTPSFFEGFVAAFGRRIARVARGKRSNSQTNINCF
jgi:hypothetical protein